MNTLAIDTSSAYLSLALKSGGQVYTFMEKVDNKHSENLIPHIYTLLQNAELDVRQLNNIVYNQGPGSFTGLRIGLSVALGIAYGLNIQLIPIPAFALYALQAHQLKGSEQVIVGIDARLNQLYFAGLNVSDMSYFIEPRLINPAEVKSLPENTLIGTGFTVYKEQFTQALNTENLITTAEYPHAGYLLQLAICGGFLPVSAADADLLYVRNKVALNLDEQKSKIS